MFSQNKQNLKIQCLGNNILHNSHRRHNNITNLDLFIFHHNAKISESDIGLGNMKGERSFLLRNEMEYLARLLLRGRRATITKLLRN